MKNGLKNIIILSIFLVFSSIEVSGQNYPPQPAMMETTTDDPVDCGEGGGGGPSPPVGLCLPIDDYVWYLVLGGALYGIYMSRKFQEA